MPLRSPAEAGHAAAGGLDAVHVRGGSRGGRARPGDGPPLGVVRCLPRTGVEHDVLRTAARHQAPPRDLIGPSVYPSGVAASGHGGAGSGGRLPTGIGVSCAGPACVAGTAWVAGTVASVVS